MPGWTDEKLRALERAHPEGMSVQQVVAAFTADGAKLSEASFRKYVQLGLLPKSVRVGHASRRGSRGLYPVAVLRQLERFRALMEQGFTIEQIQAEFLFVRRDIDAISRQIDALLRGLTNALGEDPQAARDLDQAKAIANQLLTALEAFEARLAAQARMKRAHV